MSVRITADALPDLERYLTQLPEVSTEAARIAINSVSEGSGMKLLREAVEQEVDFPEGYVQPRIFVKRKAYNSRLEAVIAGRTRPTSLARFARGQTPESTRRRGVRVNVKGTQFMRRAFLIRLRQGKTLDADSFNLGLAIRLKPGEKIKNKRQMVKVDAGLYLLYGPSIDQVFSGVAQDKIPEVTGLVRSEFLRQFVRLSQKV